MAGVRERRILPLPPDVVAQIKSSAAVVSLVGVVLELLKNSLDAGATRIEATVDFGRGGCSIEDNGRGIVPLEFGEDGGLGKLYCLCSCLRRRCRAMFADLSRHIKVLLQRDLSRSPWHVPCLSLCHVPFDHHVPPL